MANPTPTQVRDAIKAILRTANVGIVAETIAQDPPWIKFPESPAKPFVTVRYAGAPRRAFAAPRYVERLDGFVVDLWLPVDEDTNTEERLDNLCLAAQAALQDERTLNGVVDDSEPPQLELHDPGPYMDRVGTKLCHHGRIVLQVVCDLQYAAP